MPSVEEHLDSLQQRLRVRTFDQTDLPASRSWYGHRDQAVEKANELKMLAGDIFITISRHPRGYWASEWSVMGKRGDRKVAERRSAQKKDVDEAVRSMLNQAGYARPPRKGLFGRKKKEI